MSSASFDAAIGDAERVLLDSSALIAYHSPLELVHPLAVHLLDRIERVDDPVHGYYSVISASELLIHPIRGGSRELAFMHAFLTTYPNLTLLPVDLPVATQAATLRAVTGIRLPDALVVASGLLAGCEAIVTNDDRWKRQLAPLFREFRWLFLGDYA